MRSWSDSVGLIKTESACYYVLGRRPNFVSLPCAITTITGTSLCEPPRRWRRGRRRRVEGASHGPTPKRRQRRLRPRPALRELVTPKCRDHHLRGGGAYALRVQGRRLPSITCHPNEAQVAGRHAAHDHSIATSTQQRTDFPEGDQTTLEDHGFAVRTAAIGDLVDPHAAYTLEYLDMILSALKVEGSFSRRRGAFGV